MDGKSYYIYQLIHKKKLDKIVLEVGFGRGAESAPPPVGPTDHNTPWEIGLILIDGKICWIPSS